MTYGQFKEIVNRTFPEGTNRFSIGGGVLLKLPSWSDEKLNSLTVKSYEEEYYEDENGDPERWFFVTAEEQA
jgi:hypothetical protein